METNEYIVSGDGIFWHLKDTTRKITAENGEAAQELAIDYIKSVRPKLCATFKVDGTNMHTTFALVPAKRVNFLAENRSAMKCDKIIIDFYGYPSVKQRLAYIKEHIPNTNIEYHIEDRRKNDLKLALLELALK